MSHLLRLSTFEALFLFLELKNLLTLRQCNRALQKIIYNKANPVVTISIRREKDQPIIIPTMFKKCSLAIIAHRFTSEADISLLPNMCSLQLRNTVHIGNLSKYTQLISLTIDTPHQINDTTLAHLTNLTTFVNLHRTSAITINSLSQLINLRHLTLIGYSITSPHGFEKLSYLTSLNLLNGITYEDAPMTPSDLTHLKSLINLKNLELHYIPGISDLGLNSLTYLTHLKLSYTISEHFLVSERGFKTLSNLMSLELLFSYRDRSFNIDYIMNYLPNLTNLHMDIDELLTNKGVMKLTNLRKLHIPRNKAVRDRSIKTLTKLTYLLSHDRNIPF
ncbi:MAG: hypothetical protein Harvfovirus48_2 [Harvfovirus sp.]|uniref:Leucine-rich repeat protein n=1 Tax=Harvfovirus sp. TaxID=2487768 RepID=A0A3G5A392_9VIRU|nr:MAG: hypothetical protein Harvfovirus48_2 [Harvfovirus sp.]